jgi:hypothetical protein
MNAARYITALMVVGTTLLCQGRASATVSWNDLEQRVKELLDGSALKVEDLNKEDFFSGLKRTQKRSVLLEMATLMDRPVLQHAAFLLAHDNGDQELVLEVVLRIVFTGGNDRLLAIRLQEFEYLRRQSARDEVKRHLVAYFSHNPHWRTSVEVAQHLSPQTLEELLRPNLHEYLPSSAAGILFVLSGHYDDGGIPADLAGYLEEFAVVPGDPRATYLAITGKRARNFHALLQAVVNDESVEESLWATITGNFVNELKNVNLSPDLDPKRREMINSLQRE